MKRTRVTKRLTIRLPLHLAETLSEAARQRELYEGEYVRELLRRELFPTQRHTGEAQPWEQRQTTPAAGDTDQVA